MTASLCMYFTSSSAMGVRQFGKCSVIFFAKPKGILGSITCCLSSGYNYYNMSCANAAATTVLDPTLIASSVIFNMYSSCLPLLCGSS